MTASLWQQCLNRLQDELPSAEFSMWIRPLQAELSDNTLTLYAPNRFVLDWVRDKYLLRVNGIINELCGADAPTLRFDIGNRPHPVAVARAPARGVDPVNNSHKSWESKAETKPEPNHKSNTNVNYTFENFVEGKSNQLARAAARQVADNPGGAYNPLFLYGGTGLGKTTCCTPLATPSRNARKTPKSSTCTPNGSCRTW